MAEQVKIFGVRFDNVSAEKAYQRFVEFLKQDRTSVIFTPNPEIVMAAQENAGLKEALLEGDLVVPDGIGIIYASKVHRLGLTERVGGVDLSERAFQFLNAKSGSIYLLGSKPEVAEVAAFKLSEKYPNLRVLGTHDGYFDDDGEMAIIDDINILKPDVVFVGLGSPKQELWIHKYKRILNCKVLIGIGGGIDVWAGHAKRAPHWVQKIGLEWLFRLFQEPRRIKRMIKLPAFALKVLTTRKI